MNVLLWILGILGLLGGVFLGIDEEELLWIVSGVITFAIFGGFATVIGLLKEISSNTANLKADIAKLRASSTILPDQNPGSETTPSEQTVETDLAVKDKFVCKSCGATSTGWYQKCPHCGAVGKMERNI